MTTHGRADELASIDGRIRRAGEATISVLDDGLLRGDGVFEFVRCYLGRPFTLRDHLDRMERSCALIRLECPRRQLETEVAALMEALGPQNRDLRLVLTRAGRRILLLEPFVDWGHARLALITDQPRMVLGGAKTLSYAGNMLAKRMAEERGLKEALLTRPDGRVMEVQQAAFFWADQDGTLCTPPLSEGILDSITRRVVMTRLPVEERICAAEEALAASEAFLAGTAREIHPVGIIEGHHFEPVPGPATRRAIAAYWDEVEAQLGVTAAEVAAAGV
jgi:branched-chain amino acid aminotransferase